MGEGSDILERHLLIILNIFILRDYLIWNIENILLEQLSEYIAITINSFHTGTTKLPTLFIISVYLIQVINYYVR